MPSSSALPSSEAEEREQRAQVGEVEQRQALLVGVVEDELQALLLRLVRVRAPSPSSAARSPRRSRGPGCRGRCRRSRGTRRETRRRERRCPARPPRLAPGPPAPPGPARPDRSPFTSAAKTGTPAAESCSAIGCSVLRLARAGRACDQPVAVHHPQRHLHLRLAGHLPLEDPRPSSTGVAVHRVRGGDRLAEIRHGAFVFGAAGFDIGRVYASASRASWMRAMWPSTSRPPRIVASEKCVAPSCLRSSTSARQSRHAGRDVDPEFMPTSRRPTGTVTRVCENLERVLKARKRDATGLGEVGIRSHGRGRRTSRAARLDARPLDNRPRIPYMRA